MKEIIAKPEYEIAFQDCLNLIRHHADKVNAAELLAIASNMLGKLLALQDQRTMTKEKAMKIITTNLEIGNQQAIEALENTEGTA